MISFKRFSFSLFLFAIKGRSQTGIFPGVITRVEVPDPYFIFGRIRIRSEHPDLNPSKIELVL